MKNNYPTKKLDEVCEIVMGQSPPSYTYNTNKKGLPFYQGKKDYGEKYPVPRVWCSEPTKIVEAGDILISVRAPVGALNIAEEKSCIGRGLAGLRAGEKLNQDFLFHFLKSKEKYIANLGTGSTFTAISKKHLENLEIPLPPLEIQRKIVERVEKLMGKIDEAKKLRKEATADASSLIPSALNKIFEEGKKKGWEEVKVGDVCEIITGGTPKTSVKDFYGNEFLWAGPSDLDQGVFVTKTNKKLSKKGFRESGIRIIPKSSIMMSCIGYIGKLGIAGEEMATNQQINTFVPNSKLLESKYLYYSLMYKTEEFKINSSQTTLPIINKTKCSNVEIPLPPLPEQRKIVKYLDSLSEKIRKIQAVQSETEKELKLLEKSVLNKAFVV